ncbi:hypothetical protein RHGRI_037108 [Rhododendron griersonianum]|uniref:Uncharacterized protein n=1 Tax=Rhododendron griersonianum TaxID=479676 RepID=A0AAV6HR16_9ERIC|nr:hypothetical protein RHGRI_037108 [Rhododendron griersonianum]
MSGNIGISDDEDELDAEEDEREPVDGDPINDDEDEEDGFVTYGGKLIGRYVDFVHFIFYGRKALYMFSIYTWGGGRGERAVGQHRPKPIPSIPFTTQPPPPPQSLSLSTLQVLLVQKHL